MDATNKLSLSVVCGGQSTEHEVSIRSARNVVAALDFQKYTVSVIYIDHDSNWFLISNLKDFLEHGPQYCVMQDIAEPITVLLGNSKNTWCSLRDSQRQYPVDCIFPMVHGTHGEDGALQGLLDLLNLPYVGASAQTSAICMQKDVSKRLLKQVGIPTADWHVLHSTVGLKELYPELTAKLGAQLFIKPTSLGSSVGSARVQDYQQFHQAVTNAFQYDQRVMVEPLIQGREIECSVIGNDEPKASIPGEIIPHSEFYCYKSKYINKDAASTVAPAKLTPEQIVNIQQLAVRTYQTLHCTGMARVDFFLQPDDCCIVNEINTIPGFTDISMYPKMWQVSGLSYDVLLDQLIDLALLRHQEQQTLIRCYSV